MKLIDANILNEFYIESKQRLYQAILDEVKWYFEEYPPTITGLPSWITYENGVFIVDIPQGFGDHELYYSWFDNTNIKDILNGLKELYKNVKLTSSVNESGTLLGNFYLGSDIEYTEYPLYINKVSSTVNYNFDSFSFINTGGENKNLSYQLVAYDSDSPSIGHGIQFIPNKSDHPVNLATDDGKLRVGIPYAAISTYGVVKPSTDKKSDTSWEVKNPDGLSFDVPLASKSAGLIEAGKLKDKNKEKFYYAFWSDECKRHKANIPTFKKDDPPKVSSSQAGYYNIGDDFSNTPGLLYTDKSTITWKAVTPGELAYGYYLNNTTSDNNKGYVKSLTYDENAWGFKSFEIYSPNTAQTITVGSAGSDSYSIIGCIGSSATVLNKHSSATVNSNSISGFIAYYASSDRRLKEDIKDIEKDCDIEFKQFKFKDDDRLHYGVIAQDIEEEYPELVSEDENDMKSVDYTGLLVLKMNSMKKRIDKLKEYVK